MDFIHNIDISIFSFLLISVLFINARRNNDTHSHHTKLFLSILGVNATLIVIEAFLMFANGRNELFFIISNRYLNSIYFMLAPVAATVWLFYVDFNIFSDEDRLKKYRLRYFSPAILNAILVAVSFYTDWFYYFDDNNVYQRGPFFLYMYLIPFAIILYTWFLSYYNRESVDSRDILGLQLFIMPIVVASIVQIFIPNIPLTWTSMSFSLLIVFVSIEMRKIYGDYLTGAHSRRQLDEYIRYRLRLSKKSKGFTIAMIDMDDFKYINDKYGHHEGDQALINFVKLIRKSIRGSDFVARFAGDEFVIVFDFEDDDILAFVLNRIYETINDFNKENVNSYNIKFSIGLETIRKNNTCDFDELFRIIDRKMYEQKANKKDCKE